MNNRIPPKLLTTIAFVIGLALIDDLTPNEQNALGNWLMLVAQVLCTNGSEHFKNEWHSHIDNHSETDHNYTVRMLEIVKREVSKQIDNLKE